MLKFEHEDVIGWYGAIRGMRNPLESWDKSDTEFICPDEDTERICGWPEIGGEDYLLMLKLARAGTSHSKFRRMIILQVDITGPLYWWKEFDTYKVGTVVNSCSTMHKIHAHEFTPDMFSHEHLLVPTNEFGESFGEHRELSCVNVDGERAFFTPIGFLKMTCDVLNHFRDLYLKETDPELKKAYWWQMIQLLPSSYNQKRTVQLSYENLAAIYQQRADHKLDEWRVDFMEFIRQLPYFEIITLEGSEGARDDSQR